MRSIDSELERAGAEFREAGEALPERQWGKTASLWSPGRPLFVAAVAAAVVLLLAVPIAMFGGGGGSGDPIPVGGATETSAGDTLAPSVGITPTEETVPASVARFDLDDPPHLLLQAEGWEMVNYYEDSYEPWLAQQPQVFRPAGAHIGGPTLLVGILERTETTDWSAGSDPETHELDGRTVSFIAESSRPSAHAAGVEFDNGTLVLVNGYGLDRGSFIAAADAITLDKDDGPVVEPPPGFEQVDLPAPFAETVTYRQAVFQGPQANAEVRIWSGTMADVELQVFNRASEAQLVTSTTIDGAEVVVAHHSDDMSRVWVVGGADGYVIEIDFNPFIPGASDADLEAVLKQIRFVDLATFEAALPGGSVTSETVDAVVAEMLSDIPQPTEFDASAIKSTGDRYQVGAEVVGAVTCAWIEQWVDATAAGDTENVAAAVDAMLSSKGWAILLEMDAEGGYADVVWQYADGIAADGTVMGGRVLTVEESYRSAFGCP